MSAPAAASEPLSNDNHDHDLSKLPSAQDGKHYSITQSIALEHELMADEHENQPGEDQEPTAASLNPEVLTSIIVSMRESLARERSHFESTLAESTSKAAALEARCSDAEERLAESEAKLAETESKLVDSERSLTMLRQTLEESRRGIMRLQSENKRASGIIMGPPTPGAPPQATSRANKRLSLNPSRPLQPLGDGPPTPRTPMGHRRISSMSDSGAAQEYLLSRLSKTPSPNAPPVSLPGPPPSSYLLSNGSNTLSASPPATVQSFPDPAPEIASLKAEIATLKSSLSDAVGARQASEDVIRGLRELIAANSTEDGVLQPSAELHGLRLPPLPSDPDIETHEETKPEPKKTSGWAGLKLWREPSATSGSSASLYSSSSSSAPPAGSSPPLPPLPPRPTLEHTKSSPSIAGSVLSEAASESSTGAGALSGFMSWRRGSAATPPQSELPTLNTDTSTASPNSGAPSSFANETNSPASSFRSKFGFFSKVTAALPNSTTAPPSSFTSTPSTPGASGGAANGETASIASSRPTSVSTSEFHPAHNLHSLLDNRPASINEHGDESGDSGIEYDERDMVQVVLPGDDEVHNAHLGHGQEQSVLVRAEEAGGKFDGDATPTVGQYPLSASHSAGFAV